MNKLIKEQLQSLKVAPIPNFDDNTTEIIFKRYTPIQIYEGGYYLIELENSLLDPNANGVLVTNWNNGSIPKNKYYKAEVVKILGQMIKINGMAFDNTTHQDINESWCGWVLLSKIKLIEKL